jgi:hypothetical protein
VVSMFRRIIENETRIHHFDLKKELDEIGNPGGTFSLLHFSIVREHLRRSLWEIGTIYVSIF